LKQKGAAVFVNCLNAARTDKNMESEKYFNMAAIRLPQEKKAGMDLKFNELFELFCLLDGFETGGAEPLVSVLQTGRALRADEAVKNFTREELLGCMTDSDGGYIAAPKTLG